MANGLRPIRVHPKAVSEPIPPNHMAKNGKRAGSTERNLREPGVLGVLGGGRAVRKLLQWSR